FTLHLVGEVQLTTADGGWTSREIIDKGGASSLLSAVSDMAWRNTLRTGVKELFFGRGGPYEKLAALPPANVRVSDI
ncbi:unnamed protein product, partial [Ascophyllum nodosum]